MKKVEEEGYSISKGGITYIKQEHEKEITEQKEEQTEQKTEQKIEKTRPDPEPKKIDDSLSDIFKKDYTVLKDYSYLFDEFEQLKTYFRKGNRPSQTKAIENFEKHLRGLID